MKLFKNKIKNMKTQKQEITIKAPDGYIIDNEKSTATNIVFKLNEIFDYKTIRSFEDACKKLNINLNDLFWYVNREYLSKHDIAYNKLIIIYKAINNGWIPDFTNSQNKYSPYFKVSSSGLVYSVYDYSVNVIYAICSSRLCTYDSDVAKYIGETFIKEYNDYLL